MQDRNASIIIPIFMRTEQDFSIVKKCIDSLIEYTPEGKYEILAIDDCSPNKDLSKRAKEYVESWDSSTRGCYYEINKKNVGFSKSVNVWLREVSLDVLNNDAILINSDIEFVDRNWFPEIMSGDAGITGGLLVYPNGLIQHAGVYYSLIYRSFDHRFRGAPANLVEANKPINCPVTAAMQRISRECLKTVGLYDEKFTMGFEDVDYCLRARRAGFKCLYNPKVKAIHHESIFRFKNMSPKMKRWTDESRIYLYEKYSHDTFTDDAPTMLLEYDLESENE